MRIWDLNLRSLPMVIERLDAVRSSPIAGEELTPLVIKPPRSNSRSALCQTSIRRRAINPPLELFSSRLMVRCST